MGTKKAQIRIEHYNVALRFCGFLHGKFDSAKKSISYQSAKTNLKINLYFCKNDTTMLEQELETYYASVSQLREIHPLGGFVVIKGDEILDVWIHHLDALKEGYKAYGDTDFLIKDINEKPINISSFGSASTKIIL